MVEPSAVQLAHEVERLQAEVAGLRAERKLLLESLDLHERDRQLLAFDIHDGIIQDMTAALMFVESAGTQATFSTPEMREKYERGVRVLQAAVQEARRLIRGLIPVELDPLGLAASLEKLVEKFRTDQGMQIDFQAEMGIRRLAPAIELNVLRIVQEALNNVWKHSQSLRAQVHVTQHDDELEVTVTDFGAGFSLADAPSGRYGLAGIRQRAQLIGGSTTIATQPGRGTRVSLRLTLRDNVLPPARLEQAPAA
jgi:signal transduction histidine kinase